MGSIQVAFGLLTRVPNNSSTKNDGASCVYHESHYANFCRCSTGFLKLEQECKFRFIGANCLSCKKKNTNPCNQKNLNNEQQQTTTRAKSELLLFFQCLGGPPAGSIQVAFGLLTRVPNNSSTKNDGASYFYQGHFANLSLPTAFWLVQLVCSSWNKDANFDLFVSIA